jgi:hypothetical protein
MEYAIAYVILEIGKVLVVVAAAMAMYEWHVPQ